MHFIVHSLMQVQEDLLEVSWGSAVLALEPCRTVLAGKNEVRAGPPSRHAWQRSPCSAPQPSACQGSPCCSPAALVANDQGAGRPGVHGARQAWPSCWTVGMQMHCTTAASMPA